MIILYNLIEQYFYAESGGQPGDTGEIIINDRVLKVVDTQKGK